MLLDLLLSLNILVCLGLIGVVLLQRSEGGALGTGSPTGLITTRGAGDLLTRTTWILFSLFIVLSLALTLIGGRERSSQAILNRLKLQSINPDSIPAPTSPQTPGAATTPPGQSTPPAVQLPPMTGAQTAAPSAPSTRSTQAHPATAHPAAAPPATAPQTLSLPPMTAAPAPAAKPAAADTPAKPPTP